MKKKILFVHGNYPGQFKNIAWKLGQDQNYSICFITDKEEGSCEKISGVIVRTMEKQRTTTAATHHYIKACEANILAGQKVVKAIMQLLKEGFIPDIVITHGGMGLGLFVKDLLPNTKHIALFEWYFQAKTAKYLMKDYTFDQQLQTRSRNLSILSELVSCDIAVVPTKWQMNQFPREFWNKIRVIFDGIDTNFFSVEKKKSREIYLEGEDTGGKIKIGANTKILSYATRGMEPVRGFMEFIEGSIHALKNSENCIVIIGGRDRCAYSYPPNNGTWKEEAIERYKKNNLLERVMFTGLMNYGNYRNLLRRSDLHCYFTRPYVTSWSLFEAAATGARLCISEGKATENILDPKSRVCLVNLDEQDAINTGMLEGLNDSSLNSHLLIEHGLKNCIQEWMKILNN